MTPIRSEAELEDLVDLPLAVVYKHSPLCGLSTIAASEVRRFADTNPDTPVFTVDVIRDRTIAMRLADRYAIRHESPQVIVVRYGDAIWDASHRGVTAEALSKVAA